MPRHDLETVGYLKSFPHLAGSIFAFEGTEGEAAEQYERACRHEDWSEFQDMTDLVLTPAACYPVYPAIAARGPLAPGGVTVDAGGSYVFRHEPSGDPARLQMFHQREIVRIGEPETVQEWREVWRDRAVELLGALGLEVQLEVATDPFFGRSGRMLAASQRQQQLKFEVAHPDRRPRADRRRLVQLPPGSFRLLLRAAAGRRLRGAHRLSRLRPRADHDRAVPRARAGVAGVAGRGARATLGAMTQREGVMTAAATNLEESSSARPRPARVLPHERA